MQTMRILVVEDDAVIAGQIMRSLAAQGHAARHAATGRAAAEVCRAENFDAVVLDRMLPDTTGLALMEGLRGSGCLPPVLMLSALGSVEDRVEGLFAGADDYLAKPFEMKELTARLIALHRRGGRESRPDRDHAAEQDAAACDLVIGRLRLDAASHRVIFGAEAVDLNRKQFSLLTFLMRSPDRMVTRAMLLEAVWGYAFDPATNIVESNLSRLRGRLQALGCDPVETRRGAGYVLRSDKCA